MPQVRRQPRRKTKKTTLHSLRNPFSSCLAYLPVSMIKKIEHLDRVIIRHIDELVTEPEMDMNENLMLIKTALERQ